MFGVSTRDKIQAEQVARLSLRQTDPSTLIGPLNPGP